MNYSWSEQLEVFRINPKDLVYLKEVRIDLQVALAYQDQDLVLEIKNVHPKVRELATEISKNWLSIHTLNTKGKEHCHLLSSGRTYFKYCQGTCEVFKNEEELSRTPDFSTWECVDGMTLERKREIIAMRPVNIFKVRESTLISFALRRMSVWVWKIHDHTFVTDDPYKCLLVDLQDPRRMTFRELEEVKKIDEFIHLKVPRIPVYFIYDSRMPEMRPECCDPDLVFLFER